MRTNILADFQICFSAPLIRIQWKEKKRKKSDSEKNENTKKTDLIICWKRWNKFLWYIDNEEVW